MKSSSVLSGLFGGAIGAGVVLSRRRSSRSGAPLQPSPAAIGTGAVIGMAAGAIAEALVQLPRRIGKLESLMPKAQVNFSSSQVKKPTPSNLFTDRGTGTDFETRLSSLNGYLTPNDRFFIRSHSPTPAIDASQWRLVIEGTGVRTRTEFTYEELCALPQTTITRTIECAGNGRRFFKEFFGVEGEGGQWRTGAIGCAEWSGVPLKDLFARAGLADDAQSVMPKGLDDHQVSWPMPLEKALREDTLLALRMNGETLPADHGFPARLVVSGWVGTASIKWIGTIEVSRLPLYSPYNTIEYVMVGPKYPMQYPALGPPITEMPVTSMIDLDWPAQIGVDRRVISGRAFAGEGRVQEVRYRIDNSPWKMAELLPPNIEGCWVRWQFNWDPAPGRHEIRVRARDEQGRAQQDEVPWNHHGYLYNAVVAHPVEVS